MITIADVTSDEDMEHVRSLFREYRSAFAGEAAFQEYLALQDFEAELAALPGAYAPPTGALLLAVRSGEPAGCVAVKSLGGGVCELKRLYVRPGCRGAGLGRVLVEGIITRARGLGYRLMRLDTLPSMRRAQSLYGSCGFREIAPYCESPVGDAVYMELRL